MFRNKHQQAGGNAQEALANSMSRPLLYVLAPGEAINDPHQIHQAIFKGQTDVPIDCAEMDLTKAVQSLAFISNTSINSLPTLTALSLPKTAIPLFWTIHVLLQQQHQTSGLENPIYHRNHDARLLYQQLARLDLSSWYAHSVTQVSLGQLPVEAHFPPGHPNPGMMYRHYPYGIKDQAHYYYPVTSYFPMLFADREQELITLLSDLGATQIVIESVNGGQSSAYAAPNTKRPRKVFNYVPRAVPVAETINIQNYHWLAYETTWQSVINERYRGLTSVEFEFGMDVMDLLGTQIRSIDQLMPELNSITPPNHYKEILYQQLIETRTVQVQFGA